MALLTDKTKAAVQQLNPAKSIPTAKTINTGDIEMAASDIIQSEMAQANASDMRMRTALNTGKVISESAQKFAEIAFNAQRQKYLNVYNTINPHISSIANNSLSVIRNTVDRGEITQASSSAQAAIFGAVDASSSGLPDAMKEQLHSSAMAAVSKIQQTSQSKIHRITYDSNLNDFKKALQPNASTLAYQYVNAKDGKERQFVVEQAHKMIDEANNFVASAPTLSAKHIAEQSRDWITSELNKMTSPQKISTDTSVRNAQDTQSINIHSTGAQSTKLVDETWFNHRNPDRVDYQPAGGVDGYTKTHQLQTEVHQESLNFIASSNPMAFLHNMLTSDNPTVRRLGKETIDRFNRGDALGTITNMDPAGELAKSYHDYILSRSEGVSDTQRSASYQRFRASQITAASRYGLSTQDFGVPTPRIDASMLSLNGQTQQKDSEGNTTGYNLLNKSNDINDMMSNADALSHGRLLSGDTDVIRGLNFSMMGSFAPNKYGKGVVADNSVQSQLDVLSFDKPFQDSMKKQDGVFTNKTLKISGIINFKNHKSLVSNIQSDPSFSVNDFSSSIGVPKHEVAKALASQVEYFASKGDEDALETVKLMVKMKISTQEMVSPEQHWYEESPNMHVKGVVWDSYTGYSHFSDNENRHLGSLIINKAYEKNLKFKSEQIQDSWERNDKNKSLSPESRSLAAENAAKLVIGKPKGYVLINDGDKMVVRRSGRPDLNQDVQPHEVEVLMHKAKSEKEKTIKGIQFVSTRRG